MLGDERTFGTPLYPPHFAMPLTTAAQTFWLYVSLNKAAVFDGATHTDITRLAGDYTNDETRKWNGTILGGVPILNNGNDVPQAWLSPTTATKLVNLPNWNPNHRARVVRALGPYLIAINILDSGNAYPHLIQWSHPADPGSVPISWDYADPTKDAGRKDLPDVNSGLLIEALPLQGRLFLYKEGSVWWMRAIGGRFVFEFDTFLETVGLLAPRCVTPTPDGLQHVMATQDDIVRHNGNQVVSILDKAQKRAIFNDIDNTYAANSFMFTNPLYNEVWFCYPSSGNEHPNKAVVWNAKEGQAGILSNSDVVSFRNVASGIIEAISDASWDSDSASWDSDDSPWSQILRRKLVMCDPANTQFRMMDTGNLRNGASFAATLQREGLSVLGQNRRGEWLVDHQIMKMIQRLWPKVKGGPIRVRIGATQTVGGATTWGPYATFDPVVQKWVDPSYTIPGTSTGCSISVEFSTIDPVSWRIEGYKPEIIKLGRF